MVFLAKHPLVDKYDLSSLSEIWCAAAPLSEELELAVIKRIGNVKILQGYGLTESTMGVTHNSMTDKSKSGSCGACVPGTKIKVHITIIACMCLIPCKKDNIKFILMD